VSQARTGRRRPPGDHNQPAEQGVLAMLITSRRRLLRSGAAAAVLAPLAAYAPRVLAQEGGALTIAYNVNLPAWDPTVGASAVNPTIQSIYKAVFDQYVDQAPDLGLKPDRKGVV